MLHKVAAVALFGAISAQSLASIHYFTQDGTLYRSNNGAPHTSVALTLGGNPISGFSGLAFAPDGTLWGHSNSSLYTINPMTGAVTLKFALPNGGNLITFDFREHNGVLEVFGMVNRTGGSNDTLERFNASTGAFLGGFQVTGTNPGFPASGYDPATGHYYMALGTDFSIRRFNVNGDVAGGTLVGNTGVTWSNSGGAWFEGVFHLGYRVGTTGNPGNDLVFGTINTTTGAFTESFRFTDIPTGSAFGYAVIPTPGALALLIAGGAFIGRRRR